MELQHLIVLLSTVAAGVSRRTLENVKHEASCMSHCTGYGGLGLPTGSKLSYRYSTSTNTFLQGRADKRGGISLEITAVVEVLAKCHAVLQLENVDIKTTFESEEKLHKENVDLREVLEQHPLLFCFHNGKILKIFPQEREPTWALNIKRGILSVLQTSWTAAVTNSTVQEVDIVGKCPTEYQQKGPLLLKTKDLDLCSHRVSVFTSLRSVALPNTPSQEQLLSSKLECVQRFKEQILEEARCTESHLVTPPTRKGAGVTTQTQTSMKLFETEAGITLHERADMKDIYESSLLYEREIAAQLSGEEQEEVVADILQKLCMKPRVDFESTELFMTLVFELRHLSADALMNLWQRSWSKCQGNWHPLSDALPSCTTEACVVLMKELIVSGKVGEEKIESFLQSLSYIPEPTAGMIDALAPLLQISKERQSAFFGITALVNHFCSKRNNCDQEPAVWGIMKNLERRLGEKCTLHDSEGIGQVGLILKAIGNAGLAAAPLEPVLSSCATLKSNPTEIRLAAIEAYQRIPCTANREVLLHLYQTYDEDVEIRIASYLMSVKCPNKELFDQVKFTLQEEKSSQVGSFVWSHLSELLGTEDPLKQHLKHLLPDDILSKEFDREMWKFSSYSDVTFHSGAASANAEAKIIFSPVSFLPRSIATNFTIHMLGRAVNFLEAGVRLENVEDVVRRFFGLQSDQNAKERYPKPEAPVEKADKSHPDHLTSTRTSFRNDLPSKGRKPKLKMGRQSCPNGQYSKMSELVKKFTKRMAKKKKPKCDLSIKMFGNELAVLDCRDLRSRAKRYYLNMAELVVKLLKGQEIRFNKRLSLATEELLFPAISGLPVLLALNASAAINVTFKGNMDFKQRNNFFINGYIKPRALFQISAQMGTVGLLGKTGLSWSTRLRSSTSLDGGIQVKKGKEFKIFLNTPEESMEIVHFSSKFYPMAVAETDARDDFSGQVETKSCTNEEVSKIFGWQLCSEFSKPDHQNDGSIFPFPGPMKAAVTLRKRDRNLYQYLMRATYNYVSQKGSWIPNEAGLHFFMGTPRSELKRDIAVDFHFNGVQKKFGVQFIHPKKKMQVNGKIEVSRNSRIGYLELILDDNSIYYLKGRTDLQVVAGEQRYTTQLEAKVLKYGSPIIFSGNITKQPGKRMMFSLSLVNLLKDAAFLAVCLEKKANEKLKQYSLEGETHVPGVLGLHVIALLQHQGRFWSNALRIKYGLFGEAKHLQHECNVGQKLKVDNGPQDNYRLDLDHELHCTQMLPYNHKIHLHHEETLSQLNSQLEVNYGKHWDESNNKKRVIISQTFKNNSYPALTSYFMEFTVQVPEKQVDYRTQLQHSHTTQSYAESSTHFKVHYNNHMPFVAGLQWKDKSRHSLKKWEGTFNMDTPWLYLYAAHKLQQPQHSVYLATAELTARKAFVVRGLVIELFCNDNPDEKEGKVWIHTPTTTYLRAFTVNHFKKGFLHSQSEIVSLWNQLVKNEIFLENNEQTKVLHFKIKSAKQEFNMTTAYLHLEAPRKTNVSMCIRWTDHKNLPLVLQLEAQIEEVKKEKMLYQKHGIVLFRHPFKLPIPQSFLLQETFTVDKNEKHYLLETRVLIHGRDECVQTLTLGYQAENPYICAALAHPYSSKIFPPNIEACARMRNLSHVKNEVEVNFKVNRKDVFRFIGQYHNKSSMAISQHTVHLEMTHSFQFKIPRSVSMNGELFSRESKQANFAWVLIINATVNQHNTSQFIAWLNGSDTGFGIYSQLFHWNQLNVPAGFQARATTNRYGRNGFNGSFCLHASGKDVILLEMDFNKEMKRDTRALRVSSILRQTVLTWCNHLRLQFVGKMSPTRLVLSSGLKLDQNDFHLSIMGSREQKAGLALRANIRHNLDSFRHILPEALALESSLKRKKNLHEGVVNVLVNQSLFGVLIQNRNMFGNESFRNITVLVTQNGSHTFPAETKLRGQLEFKKGSHRCAISMQMDTGMLCLDITSIIVQGQMGVTGTLAHNISTLYTAGLSTESSITAMYGHGDANKTVTITFQGGNRRIAAIFGLQKPDQEPFQGLLTASVSHNVTELKQRGMPFTVECACYYKNFSSKFVAGMTIHADKEGFQLELRNQGTSSTRWFFLFFRHNVGQLLHVIPPEVKVSCDGESTSHQLSGHCSGEVANHLLEAPARILLNGSWLMSNCAADVMGEINSSDAFARFQIRTTCNPEQTVELSLRHDWPYFKSLSFPQENRLKVAIAEGNKGLFEVLLGECVLTGKGELSAEGGLTAAEWKAALLDQCAHLENMELPPDLISGGSFFKNAHNVTLTAYFQGGGKAAEVKVELSSVDRHTLEGHLNHSVPFLRDLGLPPDNAVLLSMANGSALEGFLRLHLGSCSLEAQGEIQPQNRTEWALEVETGCTTLQNLGVPVTMSGAGHVSISKRNVDSQVVFTAGENTLRGLLILKGMDNREELHALLTQNVKGSIHLGIPGRTEVEIVSEKNGPIQKRLLQFTVDGKQITEELSFTANSDHLSLDYKLTHNLEALKTFGIQDRIELQVAVMLLDVKNLTVKLLYGSCWITMEGQMQNTAGRMDLNGNLYHSWPWLLQSYVPEAIQLTFLEILSENQTETSLRLTGDPNLSLWFTFIAKGKWQSAEFHVKSLQNLPFLLQYFPNVAEVSSKINYATKEAEGKLSIEMEDKDFRVVTKLASTGLNRTQSLQLVHTMPQFIVLPRQVLLTTAYQKSKRSHALRWMAFWDGKEVKVTGSYTGPFAKLSGGGHDLKVEICHPFSVPFPQHSTLSLHLEHSARSHKDAILIGWDTKQQVLVSSSLKRGKEHTHYYAAVAHPFNFTVSHIEVSLLTKRPRGSYNQQMQFAWNDGQPSHLKFTFGDNSKANVTLWDACMTASSHQLQNILAVPGFQACGSIEQTASLFNQHIDLKWDSKKVTQNLTYEKDKILHQDKMHVEAILENVFSTPRSSQYLLGKVETDFSSWLNHDMIISTFPNASDTIVTLSGTHQLNKGKILWLLESKVGLAGKEGSVMVAIRNQSQGGRKNYSTEISLKASGTVWLGVTGNMTSSDDQRQILIEGNLDPKEKMKIIASKGKGCVQCNMEYLKGNSEDRLELAVCSDGQHHATLSAHLVNGQRLEELGHLALEASNHSLRLKAHSCHDPIDKTESKLNEIVANLQHRLVAKIRILDEQLQDFQKLVQHIEFLQDAASWPLKVFQEVTGIFQNRMRGVIQMWKQSGIKKALQRDLPLYLGKLHDVVQQMQMELQKPLTTLKEAYYDVTLKPLDEVWQQKTEEYLKKLQAFVPTVVKDVWLMKPIQMSLSGLKTALDVATQQMLSWAEAKFSRAISSLQKPLSTLYSFSPRNRSLVVTLPVVPKGKPTLYVTHLTNYLIEEKLMKPFRSLYNINLVAEYYRAKQTMMETPFEYHALLMGYKHLRTFDGEMYSLTSKCSVLLAKDFIHDTFTILLNLNSSGVKSLHAYMNDTAVVIHPERKIYSKYNGSQWDNGCHHVDIPLEENSIVMQRESDHIDISTTSGASFSCDLRYDLCTLTLDGWHHAASAGLLGTNDNEAGNEWMLPDHSYAESLEEFIGGWQVSDHCSQAKRAEKPCFNTSSSKICNTFFQDFNSPFRNCFRVVDPEPFRSLCISHTCELPNIKAPCTMAAAFVHLCNRNFVPLEMPFQCDGELRLRPHIEAT